MWKVESSTKLPNGREVSFLEHASAKALRSHCSIITLSGPKHPHAAAICGFGTGLPGALEIGQFQSSAVKDLIDIYPRHGYLKQRLLHSPRVATGTSVSADEDIRLGRRGCTAKVWDRRRVIQSRRPRRWYVFHTAHYFQQLPSRGIDCVMSSSREAQASAAPWYR